MFSKYIKVDRKDGLDIILDFVNEGASMGFNLYKTKKSPLFNKDFERQLVVSDVSVKFFRERIFLGLLSFDLIPENTDVVVYVSKNNTDMIIKAREYSSFVYYIVGKRT